jgi:formylglycine-generating enzyme required for sulfatase activity
MALIPEGTFIMGSPEGETGRREREGPQHEVTVPSFFMSRYPITQAQWRAVATLDAVDHDLTADPSYFKGNNLPVERVSWHPAVEFCQRLKKLTNRPYRLSSEAEWEYACRAETTTPFYFGSTISTQVANYKSDTQDIVLATYDLSKVKQATTVAVDHFQIANRFGLCNMHGNVWEWCQDQWQQSYHHKLSGNDARQKTSQAQADHRVVRGGSWFSPPEECRSASRFHFRPNNRNRNVGFRVICERL